MKRLPNEHTLGNEQEETLGRQSRRKSGVAPGSCPAAVRRSPDSQDMEERDMIIKIFLCSMTLGVIAGFAAMLDRGHARAIDSLVQMPTCQGSDANCQAMSSTAKASTHHFFAMLAMH